MAAVIDIYNIALQRAGHTEKVAAIGEGSTAEILCTSFYDQKRQEALELVLWQFAKRRVTLAVKAGTPPGGWPFQYALPADCLRFRGILVPGIRVATIDEKIPFEVMADDTGSVIYTDMEQAEGLYTMDVTDVNRFSALFRSALGFAIGAEIAIPLKGTPGEATSRLLQQAYSLVLTQAAAVNRSQAFDKTPDGAFIKGRV
jgi:hypothetical protein